MRYVSGTFDEDKVYDEIERILCDSTSEAGCTLQPHLLPVDRTRVLPDHRRQARRASGWTPAEQADVRIVIEKPFGYDLASARELNSQLLDVFDESQIYRIDHYLGKETVQNLMALRFANALFEPVWNRNYIDSVQITAAEDIGIGTRAGYYEGAGALRDLVQNHMMQLLALLAMEPPAAFEANRLRDEKLKVLEAIVPPEIDKVASMAVRASVRPRVSPAASTCPATATSRGWRPTRAPRHTRRCACTCPTGAGPACRSTCAPASGWRAR